ncbi:hypothetical protein LTR56_023147 [Elasticomyces elasticus]|nr:hypothetical protein LTR56_023147 [Elasticomyces elasticus]KAK3626647.1 hypothetical protein LTR22_023074 [Elasticomyces elasticus]KAK5764898.1 hypothetical protein LTS12_004925 [Elasticomyces elasticus]
MAEFGIASGALQVADAGLKLAKTLYNYLDAVRKADKELSSLAREVTVTSTTLSSLGHVLQDNKAPALYTQDLVDEAKLAFRSCEDAFKDVDATFKSVVRFDTDGKGQVYLYAASDDQLADSAAVFVTSKGRWAWPLKKGKIDMLQANLERLKTTLLLMLSVLSFAKANAKSDRADDSRVAVEKLQIDNLIKAQEDATTRYVDATNLVTTNAFITIPPTQALPLGGRTPVDVHSSIAQPEHAIRSQLSICVSAVSQLAQAFDTAAHSWKVGTNLELAAMSNAFDDVKYHFVHLHRINTTIQSQRRHDSDAGSAATASPCPLPNSRTRPPDPPEDEGTALVSQAYMKVQQQQGLHNVTHQQHHGLQQQQLSQSCFETTPATSMGRDHRTPSPDRQGTSPQEQDPQNSSIEVKQAEQPFESIDDGSFSTSMDFAALQGGDVLANFDFDSFLHVSESETGLNVAANPTTGDNGEVGPVPTSPDPPHLAHQTSSIPLDLRRSPGRRPSEPISHADRIALIYYDLAPSGAGEPSASEPALKRKWGRRVGRPPKADKQTQEVAPMRKRYRPAKAQELAKGVVAAGQKDEAGSLQSPASYPHIAPRTAGNSGNEMTSNAVDALVKKWTKVALA